MLRASSTCVQNVITFRQAVLWDAIESSWKKKNKKKANGYNRCQYTLCMSPKYIKIEKKLLFYSISQYYFFDQTNGILVTPMIFLPIKRKKKKKKNPEAVTPVKCHVHMVKYLISKLVNVLHTYKTKLPHTSFS